MSPEQRTQAQPARIEILLEILLYIDATALARRRCQATGAGRFVQRRTYWRAVVCGVRQVKYKSRLSQTSVCRLVHRIGLRVGASCHTLLSRIVSRTRMNIAGLLIVIVFAWWLSSLIID